MGSTELPAYLMHEGKTFHQYSDRWESRPRYTVSTADLQGKPTVLSAARHYRLVFRDIARSTDEHTMIAAIAPPGVVFGHTATVERAPGQRPNADALVLCALLNSHPFDWLARLKAGTHLSLYLIEAIPVPDITPPAALFLAHAALRLSCNHAGYAALWQEQLGQSWRGPPLPDPAQRWRLRGAIDAVVALAYGLTPDAYERVLDGFSHKSFPRAADHSRAAFQALTAAGWEPFSRQHDPYADVAWVGAVPHDASAGATRSQGDGAAEFRLTRSRQRAHSGR
jgi:hypothetical protein